MRRGMAMTALAAGAVLAALSSGAASGAKPAPKPAPKPAATAKKASPAPYYASISAAKARMRTGPGRNFPATWLYVRPDLPVRVVDSFKEWRKVEDPDGAHGWVLGVMIGKARTAIVRGAAPVALRDRPMGGRIEWRAAPGVVGRVSACRNGWCRLDVKGQAGFVEVANLWGVEPDETLP